MSRLSRTGRPLLVVGVLLAQYVLGLVSASRTSATVDEVAYVPAGVSYWLKHDWRLSRDHPILMKYVLGALPAAAGPNLPDDDAWTGGDQWVFGHAFVRANAWRIQALLMWARLPVLLLGCATSLLAMHWATRLYGRAAGMVALVLCAFGPNLLAHSQLATLDTGLTCFVLATVYTFSRIGTADRARHALMWAAVTGLALAAACMVKYSALLVGALLVPLAVVHIVRPARSPAADPDSGPRPTRLALLGAYILVPVVAILAINALYGFRGTFQTLAARHPESGLLQRLSAGPLGGVGVPLPARYVAGLDTQLAHGAGGQGIYLNGRLLRHGVWTYFLEALALKTPIAYQLLLGIGLATVFWSRTRRWRDELLLLMVIAGYLGVMSAGSLQLGLRYVLPVVPLLWIVASAGAAMLARRTLGVVVLVLALVFGVGDHLRHYPHSLAYFNQYAGGPARGYRYLADSNIDWGQDLIRLGDYLRREGIPQVHMAYFGRVNPQVYGIRWAPIPPRPTPWVYVVSTNFVAGVGYLSRWRGQVFKIGKKHSKGVWYIRSLGPGRTRGREYAINWLMEMTPDDRIGYSLWVYRIDTGARVYEEAVRGSAPPVVSG